MFDDRKSAGAKLAGKLLRYKRRKNCVVLAIPRGGVEVGRVVAQKLGVPLDVVVVKKIGAPGQEELAIGAVGPPLVGDELPLVVWDEASCQMMGVDGGWQRRLVDQKGQEVCQRIESYRGNRGDLQVGGKTAILVDDGVATGETVKVAIEWLRASGVGKIVLAVPVAPTDTWERLAKLVDEGVVLELPDDFEAVGQFYLDFPVVSDEMVKELLKLG